MVLWPHSSCDQHRVQKKVTSCRCSCHFQPVNGSFVFFNNSLLVLWHCCQGAGLVPHTPGSRPGGVTALSFCYKYINTQDCLRYTGVAKMLNNYLEKNSLCHLLAWKLSSVRFRAGGQMDFKWSIFRNVKVLSDTGDLS